VSPDLKVGGPATMQTQHLLSFLNRAKAMEAPVDFVSSHLYPTDANCTHAEVQMKRLFFCDAIFSCNTGDIQK
jgi:hypothetical protein